ncbi:MAG: hypothetical protein D6730_15760 [Bacteroidetes bacterium]|nr:MAG: hypothetical protein D6730_15760 [Bacteroidota bacterium]
MRERNIQPLLGVDFLVELPQGGRYSVHLPLVQAGVLYFCNGKVAEIFTCLGKKGYVLDLSFVPECLVELCQRLKVRFSQQGALPDSSSTRYIAHHQGGFAVGGMRNFAVAQIAEPLLPQYLQGISLVPNEGKGPGSMGNFYKMRTPHALVDSHHTFTVLSRSAGKDGKGIVRNLLQYLPKRAFLLRAELEAARNE